MIVSLLQRYVKDQTSIDLEVASQQVTAHREANKAMTEEA